jgi:PUA domain protein
MKLRKRRRLRRREALVIAKEIEAATGQHVFGAEDVVETAEFGGLQWILVGGQVLGVILDGHPFLTVRGLLKYGATKSHVSVNMGAVPFIYNGADVMAPGIVEADRSLAEGDPCWVRDERNLTPLAVGVALMSGDEMVARGKGKAVKTYHCVGDRIWKLNEKG